MDKTDHLMAENNENIKDSQKGQVTPKKNIFKQSFVRLPLYLFTEVTSEVKSFGSKRPVTISLDVDVHAEHAR
jgi:hypothetical protein